MLLAASSEQSIFNLVNWLKCRISLGKSPITKIVLFFLVSKFFVFKKKSRKNKCCADLKLFLFWKQNRLILTDMCMFKDDLLFAMTQVRLYGVQVSS